MCGMWRPWSKRGLDASSFSRGQAGETKEIRGQSPNKEGALSTTLWPPTTTMITMDMLLISPSCQAFVLLK